MAVLRAVSFAVWLYALAFIFVPVMATCLPLVKRRDRERRGVMDRLIRSWTRLLCFPFWRVDVVGVENLPPQGQNCIFVANHQSFVDIFSVLLLPRSFKFISKASVFKIPAIGFTMRAADHIGLEREDRKSQVEVFRKSMQKLESGASLFIFPEGTRSKDGTMLEFKAKGAFGMARRAKVPIVPITILGSGRIMPSGKEYCLYRSGAGVQMVVHPTITAKEVQELPDDELVARARATIEASLPQSQQALSESQSP